MSFELGDLFSYLAHRSFLILFMRLFVALDIADEIRERIGRYVEGVQNFAPEARWVKEESMHVTLKFIGEQSDTALESIKQALSTVGGRCASITFRGYGFFPTAKSARVFWIGMEAGPELASLAAEIDEKLAAVGVPREQRKFSPHLTLARSAGGSGSPRRLKGDRVTGTFERLQQKLAALGTPEFGSMAAREFCLYRSQLSPKGSKYTKLERFPLQTE
jgi:RNA 2',3'-cyclic 3'-phosphodiesterase